MLESGLIIIIFNWKNSFSSFVFRSGGGDSVEPGNQYYRSDSPFPVANGKLYFSD